MKNFKTGFTIAEILITLIVIGVISMLTIPSLIANKNEAETVAKVKKFYSSMEEAYRLSRIDNGPASFWSLPNCRKLGNGRVKAFVSASQYPNCMEDLASYIVPYLNISKDCKTDTGCFGYKSTMGFLNGTMHNVNYDQSDVYYKLILLDGSYLWFRGTDNYCVNNDGYTTKTCAIMWVDINGTRKPNTMGKDIFYLSLTADGVSPPKTMDDCKMNGQGWSCLSYILRNDDMKYPKR